MDDVQQNGLSYALPQEFCSRSHRFDFTVVLVNDLKSATTTKFRIQPRRPKGDGWLAQFV
jgi:hypothetical protein